MFDKFYHFSWSRYADCLHAEGARLLPLFYAKLLLHDRTGVIKKLLKVTVQFETERNGQNGIFNHTDRSEVKL